MLRIHLSWTVCGENGMCLMTKYKKDFDITGGGQRYFFLGMGVQLHPGSPE
jgi:hypothetical protein